MTKSLNLIEGVLEPGWLVLMKQKYDCKKSSWKDGLLAGRKFHGLMYCSPVPINHLQNSIQQHLTWMLQETQLKEVVVEPEVVQVAGMGSLKVGNNNLKGVALLGYC